MTEARMDRVLTGPPAEAGMAARALDSAPPDRPLYASHRGIRSYVLRSGRMTAAQQRAYEELSPRYCLSGFAPVPSYAAVFGNPHPVTIEIGFGMGIATAWIAQDNPDRNYLGIEVHKPGIGRLLWEIEHRALENIRIIECDAVETLEYRIADESAAGFHIFFPDPWPKKKHHKRRLITRPFTDLLAEKLAPGAYLYMVTDSEDYAQWALAELSATAKLRNPYRDHAAGFAPPQSWRPPTKFEAKGRAKNHVIRELYFCKASDQPLIHDNFPGGVAGAGSGETPPPQRGEARNGVRAGGETSPPESLRGNLGFEIGSRTLGAGTARVTGDCRG
jgi:tRNA (guanine-N7-)-methyltransferase